MNVMISCEAGGNAVPPQFIAQQRFAEENEEKPIKSPKKAVQSGQLPETLGCDESAKYVAERMAKQLHAPLIANQYSLDLIDVTRSLHHRQLFPLLTRSWPTADRQRLIDSIYQPYRAQVRSEISKLMVRSSFAVHLSVRTFDLRSSKDKLRRADIGLLYDPASQDEVDLCLDWYDEMYYEVPMLRVRRNYPRRGTTDSITKSMRAEFAAQNYLGIEILLNRAWAGRAVAVRDKVIDGICWTLIGVLGASYSEAA